MFGSFKHWVNVKISQHCILTTTSLRRNKETYVTYLLVDTTENSVKINLKLTMSLQLFNTL